MPIDLDLATGGCFDREELRELRQRQIQIWAFRVPSVAVPWLSVWTGDTAKAFIYLCFLADCRRGTLGEATLEEIAAHIGQDEEGALLALDDLLGKSWVSQRTVLPGDETRYWLSTGED